MSRFLKYCNLDLDSLLRLSQQELSNLIEGSCYQSKGSSKSLLIPVASEDSTISKELVAEAEGYP